ncbi:hypothetical protein GT755_27235 [Herbidospora sp. NEAU-GS84]|uniref:Uncharacterized protein n=1 Tax=Herbidospora solisilvae TaxID=2696284 RepID=A0A7C9J5T6_9ACTN|nr:hypothetical protein [Herbidospora solisilvae]NAS25366.1 hypothetical protein [Herbidospora solisilvae]
MTLIVGYISHNYAAIASDRMITIKRAGQSNIYQDVENKAVVLNGQAIMGYTGFARLGGMYTDKWVVEELSKVDPSEYFKALAGKSQRAIDAIRQAAGLDRSGTGHAYVIAGYPVLERSDAQRRRVPAIATISNALGSHYRSWRPRPAFEVNRHVLPDDRDLLLKIAGILPSTDEIDRTKNFIRSYRKRHPDGFLGIAQALVRLIRSVSDPGVGRNISLSVMPRAVVPSLEVEASKLGVMEPIERVACMYVPDGEDLDKADYYFPAMVTPSMAAWGSETWIGRKPPWW